MAGREGWADGEAGKKEGEKKKAGQFTCFIGFFGQFLFSSIGFSFNLHYYQCLV
jgi:hypothetical protein